MWYYQNYLKTVFEHHLIRRWEGRSCELKSEKSAVCGLDTCRYYTLSIEFSVYFSLLPREVGVDLDQSMFVPVLK